MALSNDCVHDALIQLIPLVHNAFSQLMDVPDFGLIACPRAKKVI